MPYIRTMTNRGRPKVGERISFRMPEEMLTVLDARAASAGISRAETLRVIVEEALRSTDGGVDRTQIDARLALTPAERVRTMTRDARRLQAIRGRAAS